MPQCVFRSFLYQSGYLRASVLFPCANIKLVRIMNSKYMIVSNSSYVRFCSRLMKTRTSKLDLFRLFHYPSSTVLLLGQRHVLKHLSISIRQVFTNRSFHELETVYNYRLIWRAMGMVSKPLMNCKFIPGEVRLNAIKNELARRQLSQSNYYNADGAISYIKRGVVPVLLETSGPFNKCSGNKKNSDHIKAAYGLIAMLNGIAYKDCYADLELFKKLKVYFVHTADEKARLWSLSLANSKLYVLNRQRSTKVSVGVNDSKESLMAFVNMMWELKGTVKESCSTIDLIVESHEKIKTKNKIDLKDFLVENVNVKLPSKCMFDVEDLNLSSSSLRPASVYSDSNNSADDDEDDNDDDSQNGDYSDV